MATKRDIIRQQIWSLIGELTMEVYAYQPNPAEYRWVMGEEMIELLSEGKGMVTIDPNSGKPMIHEWLVDVENDNQHPYWIYFLGGNKAELAAVTFKGTSKIYRGTARGQKPRIHPTQKPVELYKWLLANYAKPGDNILDTHLGSGSICIACHDLGFEMMGIELDPEYYEAAKRRLMDHQERNLRCRDDYQSAEVQPTLFDNQR